MGIRTVRSRFARGNQPYPPRKEYALLINCTPFGLYRTIESLPILQKIQLVYSPLPPKVAASQGIKKGFPILFVLDLLYPIPYALPRLGKRVFRFSHRFPSTPKESFDEVIAHSSKPSFWFFQIGIPRNSINIYSISFLLL